METGPLQKYAICAPRTPYGRERWMAQILVYYNQIEEDMMQVKFIQIERTIWTTVLRSTSSKEFQDIDILFKNV